MLQNVTDQFSQQLAAIEQQRQALKAEQAKVAEAERARANARAASKANLNVWVARELQRRIVLGGVTPALVQAFLEGSSSAENDLWDLTNALLTSPVYGYEQTAKGFLFNGKEMNTVEALDREMKHLLGDYGEVNGAYFLEGLLYAHLTGQTNPVNYALANVNAFPTELEPEEATKLFNLSGYHHVLGSLVDGTPQRPSYLDTDEARAQTEEN